MSALISQVDRWLLRACTSLLSTWDPEHGNFWRDSYEDKSDSASIERPDGLGRGKGATSNNRSFQALVDAAAFLSEATVEDDTEELRAQLGACAQLMVHNYFTFKLADLRGHGENGVNPYTDAQLLLSLCLALSPVAAAYCGFSLTDADHQTLIDHVVALSADVATQLSEQGVKVDDFARPHHFLTLHTVRALDAAARTLEAHDVPVPAGVDLEQRHDFGALLETMRREIVQQLGLHLLPAPGFDSSSLLSCCALLSRFTRDADSPLLRQCIGALTEDQSARGTWTTAGVIGFDRRRLVYVPSVELSLVLSNLTLVDLSEGDVDVFDRALPALEGSLRLVQSSYTLHDRRSGWRNDRTRSGQQVDSWTTAVVLRFLISFRTALTDARQEQLLKKYRAHRGSSQFPRFWQDLERLVPARQRYHMIRSSEVPEGYLDKFYGITDPTPDNSIVNGIAQEILLPTLTGASERPVDTASFLLYGPPGTRKTSLIERMAKELRWPLITLSPPAFLRGGIEGFEASADEIFEDLVHLKRVVVLFDECEDFFRWRPPPSQLESRTVGAFITSGMLPRLQRLRQERWVIFVINTNVEAFELDDAVTRRGRLDKAARVGHPVLEAQLRYLSTWSSRRSGNRLTDEHLAWFSSALGSVENEMKTQRERLAKERDVLQRDNPDRGPEYREQMSDLQKDEAKTLTKVVTFGMLDQLAQRCLGEGAGSPISTHESFVENLGQEFNRFGPDQFG
ncbi:MAG: AAA family ATPase [Actinomycetota bacterium]|nr:AAA family ATPase [Actinomycetota bacterium]